MIESSLFLAIASKDPEQIKAAITANLEYLTAEQVSDFYQGHLAALRLTG